MQKLINHPDFYVNDALGGMVAAYPEVYRQLEPNGRVVARVKAKPAGKVGVASGGGFGHLPLFAGYVGKGLLDACAVGDVFAGPPLDVVSKTLEASNFGGGVLSVLGNYGGDRMVFNMANEMLADDGVGVETVIVTDDVASATPDAAETRRGVAGVVLAFKVAGAAAEAGLGLGQTASVTRRAVENCRTIGVALSACTVPHAGKPTFELGDGKIEMGMGIHGEKGIWRGPLKPADEVADEMLHRLLADMPLTSGDRILLMCNSLGATPIEELFILYRRVAKRIEELGVRIVRPLVGHFATSMEMAGASASILRLDEKLQDYVNAPTDCPYWPA